jgi:predicted nucleic acid-binding protein
MTNTKLFIDSSIWLEYFLHTDELVGKLLDSNEGRLLTSVVCFHEVSRKLIRLTSNEAYIKEVIRFMRENSTIVSIDEDIAVKSAEASVKHRLASLDSVIYQSALSSNALLMTADNDFRGLPNAQVVKV